MKTWTPKKGEVERKWVVIDAKDRVLGRVAVECARILRGKNKPQFASHMDSGDFVIVINADKVKLTGKKLQQKVYYSHSNYPGGLKTIKAETLLKQKPDKMFRLAVRGMLPKNTLDALNLANSKFTLPIRIHIRPNSHKPTTFDME